MIDNQIPEDIPDPFHNPKTHRVSVFSMGSSRFSNEDLSLYKDLMRMLVLKEPGLNPTVQTQDANLTADFKDLTEAEQRKQYRTWSGRIVKLMKPIFQDEEYLVGLCDELDCSFLDIIHCLYSYYGALIYKQPQFSRWLTMTVGAYTNESKRALGIPVT